MRPALAAVVLAAMLPAGAPAGGFTSATRVATSAGPLAAASGMRLAVDLDGSLVAVWVVTAHVARELRDQGKGFPGSI